MKHHKLINLLKKVGLDAKGIRIIKNLYWHQTANVKIEKEFTEDIEIKRRVRQGCVLSPILFNLYSEEILAEALNESQEGIVINGETINNIRYADDTRYRLTQLKAYKRCYLKFITPARSLVST